MQPDLLLLPKFFPFAFEPFAAAELLIQKTLKASLLSV